MLGSMVTRRFVREGHRPVLIARHIDKKLIQSIEGLVDIELLDILDLARLLSVIRSYGITHIVHMAAIVGALSNKNPYQSTKINVNGTLNILEAARFMEVKRVIYASARGVYGHIGGEYADPTYKLLPEDAEKKPVRIYDAAKLMGEHIGQFYQRTYGMEFAAIRFSSSFGPGKTVRHGGMSVVSQIIEGAHSGKPVIVQRGGDQKNDFIYNKDIAKGVYLATIADKLNYNAYNVGTGVGVTLKDIASELKQFIPNAEIEIGPGLHYMGGDVHYYSIYNISRAHQDLGFSPQFTLGSAIEDYIKILQEFKAA